MVNFHSTFIFVIILSMWVLLISSIESSESEQHEPCNPYHHNRDAVEQSVVKATNLLQRFPTQVPVKDRLLVMILFSRGFQVTAASANRLNYLRCSLLQLQAQMKNTTLDIFIWGHNNTQSPLIPPYWLNETTFPRVNVIEIPEITWRRPCGLLPDSLWVTRKHFDVDYYMMGRWRLTFSLDFAKAMGYEYHLQFDDDAVLLSEIPQNFVEEARIKGYDMAASADVIGEVKHVVLGLPELTAFWLKTYAYTPKGELFSHLNPQNIQGLTSDGWDRRYHPGYFTMIRVGWWFQDDVQSYLTTVLRSGKDVEGRWQEQAVMNMMRLIFIPADRLYLSNADLGHDRHKSKNFQNWCVARGISALY